MRETQICSRIAGACRPLVTSLWLIMLCTFGVCSVLAWAQAPAPTRPQRKAASCPTLLIQGRIIALQAGQATVKTPDAYPGEKGIHPHFVVAGPTFRVQVAHARVLLADGVQPDPRPLAVGDQVAMVLCGPGSAPQPPPGLPRQQTGVAKIVERVVSGEKVITH